MVLAFPNFIFFGICPRVMRDYLNNFNGPARLGWGRTCAAHREWDDGVLAKIGDDDDREIISIDETMRAGFLNLLFLPGYCSCRVPSQLK
jgi:hypothetical protein